ncbi:hypothetical protein [Enterococcus sp. DIV1639a]|uniref:hypothetical protein n=1 Tax=Enterococcus sp. DIV1639a TaxID=2774724 RepID=UPI00363A7C47
MRRFMIRQDKTNQIKKTERSISSFCPNYSKIILYQHHLTTLLFMMIGLPFTLTDY